MESVLATVSGYKGVDRFNLIKLICRAGASFIGNMNQSVTHLVCWKFEGRKYELAKKLGIMVVNHCWIEECIKEGRHVSEEPYTYHSGEEIGPLSLDIQLTNTERIAQSIARKKLKEPIIDLESEHTDNAAWTDTILFNEDLFPELRQKNHGSNRPIRKATKRNIRKNNSTNRDCFENVLEPIIVELEELSTSQPAHFREPIKAVAKPQCEDHVEEPSTSLPAHFRRLRKRNYNSREPHCENVMLPKRNITLEDFRFTSNTKQKHQGVESLLENNNRATIPKCSDVGRHQCTSSRHASDKRTSMRAQNDIVSLNNVEEIEELNGDYQNSTVYGASSTLKNSEEQHEATNEDFININHCNRPSASSELSCVICWTNFSSTRGVLPCGHRFCFSCIQSWADQLASRRKPSTCPLCMASFICITKMEDALSSDQKIYSQTIPHDSLKIDLYILPDEAYVPPASMSAQVCFRCFSKEPEDLLKKCHICRIRCVHTYCLDPPLFPWTCVHCKDLRMIYMHNR